MWKKWSELKQVIKKRKVIFWGRGEWVEKTLPYAEFEPAFIIDNNRSEQGTREHDLDINGPEKLEEVLPQKDKYYIVITTTDFYNVSEQIESYGFEKGKDFCVTPVLINNKILSEIRSYSQKIIMSSSDPVMDSAQKGGGVYIYDTNTLTYEKVISGVTQGFGLLNGSYYFIDDNLCGVRIFDKNLKKELGLIPLPQKSRPHGMAIQKEAGHIYIAFSAMDAVGVYDTKTLQMVKLIHISEKYDRTQKAWHHINDLCVWQDSLYISMFSQSGNWRKGVFDGVIMEYGLSGGKMLGPIVSDLWMPHNVKMIDGNLCYIDSMRGNFCVSTYKVESHFSGFVRGLAYDGQFYIIGQSVHRYFDRMRGTSNNIALDGGFFILDSESKGCRFYAMPHILDIHTLEVYEG